jgi:LuxR family maltose regulon positive regulatory protein
MTGIVSRQELFARLTHGGRVTRMSAPAGSGKTFLLRSWIEDSRLAGSAAWVSVERDEHDPQRLWLAVVESLHATTAGQERIRELTPAPDLDGWAIVERLLEDLGSLEERLWLIVDDLHELRSDDGLRQLELLVLRAPPELRFVLSSRRDLRLGLHRLRLEGELTEIRVDDLRFSVGEARTLLEAAGVELSDRALTPLVDRAEGWAAGLRLAALLLAGHPDPERFAAEFSGSERTVAEYLLTEVLERQSPDVRRMLLRTSILERVSGPLADSLTGGSGAERILHELEEANAFVVSLDPQRSWFRYHHLFADLLNVELRRSEPDQLLELHAAAARWFADHGFAIEAVRHAQAARDWGAATRLLSDHWVGFHLDGQAATAHDLLTGFPPQTVATDVELAALTASDQLTQASLEEAERYLVLASQESESVPEERRGRLRVLIALFRCILAGQRGDLAAVTEESPRLLTPPEAPDPAQLGLGEDLRALGLLTLGMGQLWWLQVDEAERRLERGTVLARRIGRPYLEVIGLAHLAVAAGYRSPTLSLERSLETIELVRRHGWSETPVAAIAFAAMGSAMVVQARIEDADRWLAQGERAIRSDAQPAAGLYLQHGRALLEIARGRPKDALRMFEAAEGLADLMATPQPLVTQMHAHRLQTMLRAGQVERVEHAFAMAGDEEREAAAMQVAIAALRIAQDDPEAATVVLEPVLDGSAPPVHPRFGRIEPLLVEAKARDALGDAGAATRALERALDLAEADGVVVPFLIDPAPELLERHRQLRTAHAALISQLLDLLAGRQVAPRPGEPEPLQEPLSETETRVLRYLPTNLSMPEIADELHVSLNTIKTHMRHVYSKLDAHSRGEAVDRARALGLLAPSRR